MKNNIFKVICFLLLLIFFVITIRNIFMFKSRDGIYPLKMFYKQEEKSIDLLILGSSHTTVDIDSALLWDNYGIASYTLWGSGQPIWNTYYYMKEALKTQKPQLIVLEGYTLTIDYDYGDSSSIIKNTYGLRWSVNKIDAIKTSVREAEYIDYLVEIGQYHNRYTEIGKNDFDAYNVFPYIDEYKGTEMSFGLYESNTRPDIESYENEMLDVNMTEKNEIYYRKCIELAQEHEIPIMVVISPYPVSAEEYSIFKQAEKIATEYNVEFVDGNRLYDEIGIEFTTDFADRDHMNYKGCIKWTNYLGQVIEKYSLSDRRNDKNYVSWEVNAQHINQMVYNHKFLYIGTPIEYFKAIKDSSKSYTVVVSLDGKYKSVDIDLKNYLNQYFGIPLHLIKAGKEGVWIVQNDKIIWSMDENDFYHLELDDNDLAIYKNDIGVTEIVFNNVNLKRVENGINILVYDNYIHLLVESVGFNAEGNYNCIK